MSKNVQGFIREKCNSYHTPNLGEDYVCEAGIGRCLGLKKRISELAVTPGRLMEGNTEFLSNGIELPKIIVEYVLHKKRKREGIVRIYNDTALKALRDVSYLPKIRSMAASLIKSPPLEDRVLYYHQWHYTIKRSNYMARWMKKYAEKNHIHKLHAVLGLDHEPHIATFLRYPGYPSKLILANIYPVQIPVFTNKW